MRKLRTWTGLFLFVSACSDEPQLGQSVRAGVEMQGVEMQGVEMQGTSLAGASIQGFQYASFTLHDRVIDNVHLEGGGLVGQQSGGGLLPQTLRGADFVGAQFTGVTSATASAGATPFQARIKGVDGPFGCFDPSCQHHDDTSSTYLYSVEFLDPDPEDQGNWYPLCAPLVVDSLPPDYRAVAVAAEWNQQGDRVESTTNFTFGCRSGVIAKCVTWGYRPWDPSNDLTSPNEFVDLHEACTRMARADYCGDGAPHTMDGTWIFEWDDVGIQQPPGSDSPGWPFEAAWSRDGAICLSHERWAQLGAGTGLCPTTRRTPVTCVELLGQMICTPNICETVADADVLARTLTPALGVHLFDASAIH
jgi:ADYC domain-containing protein